MTSDFMKQHNAERIAASQFKPDTYVALIDHHWARHIVGKRRVVKVHVNGNFTLSDRAGAPQPGQWKPDWRGTTARKVGKYSGSEHLEIWTDAHSAEIVEYAAKQARIVRGMAVATLIGKRRDHLDEYTLRAVEAALGLSTAAPNEPEAD